MKKQQETNPAKGSIVFEKTRNSQKMKAAGGSRAKEKGNTRKGKDTNKDLRLSEKIHSKRKKLLTRLKEESGSAAMPMNMKYKKTKRAYDKGYGDASVMS